MIGKLNSIKVSVLPKLIYRLSATPVKIPASYFVEINKQILKFKVYMERQRPRIANTILKGKNKVGGLTLFEFKTYCELQ